MGKWSLRQKPKKKGTLGLGSRPHLREFARIVHKNYTDPLDNNQISIVLEQEQKEAYGIRPLLKLGIPIAHIGVSGGVFTNYLSSKYRVWIIAKLCSNMRLICDERKPKFIMTNSFANMERFLTYNKHRCPIVGVDIKYNENIKERTRNIAIKLGYIIMTTKCIHYKPSDDGVRSCVIYKLQSIIEL